MIQVEQEEVAFMIAQREIKIEECNEKRNNKGKRKGIKIKQKRN